MSHEFNTRTALLCNGSSVPLMAAVSALAKLHTHLEVPEAEWDVAYHLRELALGRDLAPEQVRTLVREGVLEADGKLDPVLKAVVLAAVRGSGRVLHVDSPFVDPLDGKIADFVLARDYLHAFTDRGVGDAFVANDPLRILDEVGPGDTDGVPPAPERLQNPQEFLRRILDRETDPEGPDTEPPARR